MKKAFLQAVEESSHNQYWRGHTATIAFFFNACGSEKLGKGPKRLLRSLLHQLFTQIPSLLVEFLEKRLSERCALPTKYCASTTQRSLSMSRQGPPMRNRPGIGILMNSTAPYEHSLNSQAMKSQYSLTY